MSSLMTWMVDHEQSCTELSPEWLEFTGRTHEQQIGVGWIEGIHPDDRERVLQALRAAFAMRERFQIEFRLRRRDGQYRWVSSQGDLRFDEAGATIGFRCLSTDVTEQRLARDALQKSNEALDLMLAALPAVAARLDTVGRVILWNNAARQQLGWDRDDLIGARCRFVPETFCDAFHAYFERCLAGVPVSGIDMPWLSAAGALINLSVSMLPIYAVDGTVNGVALMAHTVAQSLQADTTSRRRITLAEALRDTAATLVSTLEPEAVMNRILDTVGRVVPHDAANIMEIQGDIARVRHMRGYPPVLEERIRTATFSLDLPNYRRLIETGEPNLIVDTHADPLWVVFDDFDWIRAHVSTPIYVNGRIVGFLNLDSGTPGAFVAEDAASLQAFADQVGVALDNARLYDTLRRDSEVQRMLHRASSFLFQSDLLAASLDDIGRQFAVAVAEEFEDSICAVFLLDAGGKKFYRLARDEEPALPMPPPLHIDGAGLIAEATRTGKLIYAPDVLLDPRYLAVEPDTRSELIIPLHMGKDTIGALDLQSSRVDAFSEQDINILQIFAERASTAIENVRLVAQIRRYAAELEQRVRERTAELHRVKERVEAILNSSSDAILMIGDNGSIEQTNQAFNRMFGYEVDEVFGKRLNVIARQDDQEAINAAIPQVVDERQIVQMEIQAVTSAGALFDAEVMIAPIAEVDQRVLSFVCNVRDITPRKRVEQELRNALESERELSELKTRFITTASHEFRTPLAMIMTSSDILKNYVDKLTLEQRRGRIERIQTEVRNITYILDDLLTLSRSGSGLICEPTEIDVETLCRQILADLIAQDAAYQRVELTCEGEPKTGWLDGRLIRRILLNLLSNAVKFSQKDSRVRFMVRCLAQEKVFEIHDDGYGIPRADQERLFEAFHRARNVEMIGGTGLGLAIVKHAVEAHQGTISFASRLGVGTTFTVTIPEMSRKEGGDEQDSGH